MDRLFKAILLLSILINTININVSYINTIIILYLIASNIFRIKFKNSIYLLMVEFILTFYLYKIENTYILLFSYILMDLFLLDKNKVVYILYFIVLFISPKQNISIYIFVFSITLIFSYFYSNIIKKENNMLNLLDNERKLRYELEMVKGKLLNALQEIEEFSKVKERDRISRELHDTLGHKITGILFQLQACEKLINKDIYKSGELLKNSIKELASTLNLIRDTVHKLKPQNIYDMDFIKKIIDDFKFCKTNFQYSGDINRLKSSHFEFIVYTIKEVLTNTYKYSSATEIQINISIYETFFRLYIKDNGVGCKEIKEGMGLNSIRQRVKNFNGRINIDGQNGFMILILVPFEGGDVFEGAYSR